MNRILILAVLALAVISIDPPVFPEQYEVKFN